jgi:hypothetical protein
LNIFLLKAQSNKGMSAKVWSHFMRGPGFVLAEKQLSASPGAISWKNLPGAIYNMV